MSPQIAPYGSWKSPITSQLIASGSIRLSEPMLDGEAIYWSELRPAEEGRMVVVRCTPDGVQRDVTPAGFNARTRVHEYGGGAYAVQAGVVWFSNFVDQRLYRQEGEAAPVAWTAEREWRFADMVFDGQRRRLIAVREDHSGDGEAVNTIVSIDADRPGGGDRVLVSGADFYSSPRVCPAGRRLAWLEWNHPNMPWDGTRLWVGELGPSGELTDVQQVAGGVDESVTQPQWSPDGELYWISDRSGWWNLYRWKGGGDAEAMFPKEAEFAGPAWVFGLSDYGFVSPETMVCVYHEAGRARLTRLDTRTREATELETPFTSISYLRVAGERAVFLGGSPTAATAVARIDLTTGETRCLRRASDLEWDEGDLSVPEAIAFPTAGGETAHAFYYAPRNREFAGEEGTRPPLLVRSHGGPTSATSRNLNLNIQYWTSRGFAFLDVNYRGSTGYGREYRNRLRGNWGVVDVDDCIYGARYLVERGWADPDRLAIDGGSAGGYTTLCALAFRDDFTAGASHFGLSDLTVFVGDTHKFESRYLETLIGRWPEQEALYRERSPIHSVDRFSCPVVFFQGDEDKIVPPNQAELMVEALRRKRVPVAYVLFPGEQHGFRKAENIRRALDGQFYFFARVFGFQPAETIEPLTIENLD